MVVARGVNRAELEDYKANSFINRTGLSLAHLLNKPKINFKFICLLDKPIENSTSFSIFYFLFLIIWLKYNF